MLVCVYFKVGHFGVFGHEVLVAYFALFADGVPVVGEVDAEELGVGGGEPGFYFAYGVFCGFGGLILKWKMVMGYIFVCAYIVAGFRVVIDILPY